MCSDAPGSSLLPEPPPPSGFSNSSSMSMKSLSRGVDSSLIGLAAVNEPVLQACTGRPPSRASTCSAHQPELYLALAILLS